MNPTDPHPTDEQLGALLGAADRDAPPPDRAFLDRLRDQSTAAFQAATPGGQLAPRVEPHSRSECSTAAATQTTPTSTRRRKMILSAVRWVAAAAVLVVVGVVVAHWIGKLKQPDPVEPDNPFLV